MTFDRTKVGMEKIIEDHKKVNFKSMNSFDIKQIEKDIHDNAVKHGWWETKRPVGELIALAHSEVSEALEGYRKHDMANVEEELADIKIRLLDMLGGLADHMVNLSDPIKPDFPTQLAQLHVSLSSAFRCQGSHEAFANLIQMAIMHVDEIAADNDIDVNAAMMAKHEINKRRSYRHGGKAC